MRVAFRLAFSALAMEFISLFRFAFGLAFAAVVFVSLLPDTRPPSFSMSLVAPALWMMAS